MAGGFNRREPKGGSRIHLHHLVVEIFRRHQWLGFFELLRGYDDDVVGEFSMTLTPQARVISTPMVRGL